MELTIKRRWKREAYTIGELWIDGARVCNTLEDTDRGLSNKDAIEKIKRVKVHGKTAIPTGRYEMDFTFSPKFSKKTWCAKYGGKLPLILNVPYWEGCRFHVGNSAADTLGCVLVGKNTIKGGLTSSTATFYEVMDKYLLRAFDRREKVYLTIE